MTPHPRKRKRGVFEHFREPPLSPAQFRRRVGRFLLLAVAVIATFLFLGMLGYHVLESLPWLDAFLNASMILGGMGPVNPVTTDGGKLFAGVYALFSGIVFLVSVGLIFGPLVHRLLHKFHFDDDEAGGAA